MIARSAPSVPSRVFAAISGHLISMHSGAKAYQPIPAVQPCGKPLLIPRASTIEQGRMPSRIGSMSEPTGKYSITMPRDIAEAAKARSGPSGLSAYVAAAVARQIERDNLNELITVAEAEHGPIGDEEVQALRDQLHQAREQQTQGGANAA